MIGKLNTQISDEIKSKLYAECITILINAYQLAKSDSVFNIELEEDTYTAILVDKYMPKVPLKYKSQWFIATQVPYYTSEHLEGITSTKNASRPDIRFEKFVLSNPESFKYTIEAKKIKTSSSKLKRRYIDTGINNYLKGKYPFGCITGYVINCNSDDCVQGINKLLEKDKRNSEILKNGRSINGHSEVYYSYHSSFKLTHILLEFR